MPEVEEALPARETNVLEETGAMDQAIYVCSPDGIVQYFNQQFLDYTGLPEDVAYIGARRVDIFRYIAERGDLGPDDPQKLIAERMRILERHGAFRFQQETPGGLVLDVRQQVLPDGQLISTFTDIPPPAVWKPPWRRSPMRCLIPSARDF